MKKIIILLCILINTIMLKAQDTTSTMEAVDSAAATTAFDANEYTDAADAKILCTQKVINQTPTKIISIGWEQNLSFNNIYKKDSSTNYTDKINNMGGLRTTLTYLAYSTNKLILSIGATYWGSKVNTKAVGNNAINTQLYNNTMHIEGLNVLMFKPLNSKNFIIAQANADGSYISNDNTWRLTKKSITYYGSAMYGWKKSDYNMIAVGASYTYRLGRPLVVPILFWNKTFNERWGMELLLPARGHARYNFSTNSMLLAGFELEGQQFDLGKTNYYMQRGEIKPRLALEQKLKGFIWLSAQLGYRIGYRMIAVDKYNGGTKNEVLINNWGNSPYINIGINFVSP
jgi:hypothetical protein